jgi:hypothetical protein
VTAFAVVGSFRLQPVVILIPSDSPVLQRDRVNEPHGRLQIVASSARLLAPAAVVSLVA